MNPDRPRRPIGQDLSERSLKSVNIHKGQARVVHCRYRPGHFRFPRHCRPVFAVHRPRVHQCARPPFYGWSLLRQLRVIGYNSLPVVGLTALFTGMVLALQSYTGFSRFSAGSQIATVVVLSVTRELGPVLAGLMVAGRVGASIAAEIARCG